MIIALLIFLIAQFGLMVFLNRFVHTEADYLVAGRKTGTLLTSFSLFASWFGAESIIGSTGLIALGGLSATRGEPLAYAGCLLVMGMVLAKAIRARQDITLGDLFRDHYGRFNERLAIFILIPTSLFFAAAELQAFATILSSLTPIPMNMALILSTGIAVAYTTVGGMLGDIWTDFIHALFVMLGLILLSVILMANHPELVSTLKISDWNPIAIDQPIWQQLDVWLIPILGSLISAEALSRVMATRSPMVAQQSCFWASGLYALVGLLPVFIALLGRHLIVVPANPDAFFPTLVQQIFPVWGSVLFLGILLSAILATIDTALLCAGSFCSHNLFLPVMQKQFKLGLNDTQTVWLARCCVAGCGILAFGLTQSHQTVSELIEWASAFGSPGFLICVLGALFWPNLPHWAASLILLLGLIGPWVLAQYELGAPFTLSVLMCAVIYIVIQFAQGFKKSV